MPIDGFYPDYPDWPFSPDGVHHRDYHDKGPYHHHPLNPPNDMWRRDARCADECDDQLAVFSSVGRGLKGDGYKVRVIEGDNGETFLEGLREDSATGEYIRDWISDNIDGGTLTYKCTMHPFTSPKTFTITFSYHKTGDEEDDWVWTTPSIPYIWGDEDINVPSIDAFDGLQDQIDALVEQNARQAETIADLEARVATLEGQRRALDARMFAVERSRDDILDHIYGNDSSRASDPDWSHWKGGDVRVGEKVTIGDKLYAPGNIYWNFEADGLETLIPTGNLNVYGGYDPNKPGNVKARGLLRTHAQAAQGDVWDRYHVEPNLGLTGVWEYFDPEDPDSVNGWFKIAELND